jgi:OOP family OmpA-OmpF porin
MIGDYYRLPLGCLLAALAWPVLAVAQEVAPAQELMSLDSGELRSEITMRYDAALALTQDAGVISADNPRYLWASQAKAQCGIALGFLKSGTRDPISIGKCDDAYRHMQLAPPPPPPPPPPVPPPVSTCNTAPFIVFFDWNRSDISAEAATTLDATATMLRDCGDPSVTLDGFADRSGSDAYNQGLSKRRAAAVRAYLSAHGTPDATITAQGLGESNPRVPTADGVRELQNRRVEIMVQ